MPGKWRDRGALAPHARTAAAARISRRSLALRPSSPFPPLDCVALFHCRQVAIDRLAGTFSRGSSTLPSAGQVAEAVAALARGGLPQQG